MDEIGLNKTGEGPPRYHALARALHWLMAVGIGVEWALGYYAASLSFKAGPAKIALIMAHKTIGLIILAALLLRVAMRLLLPRPAWPGTMSTAARRAAQAGHGVLYALMALVPLSGVLHSAADGHGTPVFGLFTIPPMVKGDPLAPMLGAIHPWLVWAFLIVVLGHVAMALKHRFIDRDGIFSRMTFGTDRI